MRYQISEIVVAQTLKPPQAKISTTLPQHCHSLLLVSYSYACSINSILLTTAENKLTKVNQNYLTMKSRSHQPGHASYHLQTHPANAQTP